jgi:hypothetical protein
MTSLLDCMQFHDCLAVSNAEREHLTDTAKPPCIMFLTEGWHSAEALLTGCLWRTCVSVTAARATADTTSHAPDDRGAC